MTTNNETDIMVTATESTNDNGISMAAITSSVNNPYTFSITKEVNNHEQSIIFRRKSFRCPRVYKS